MRRQLVCLFVVILRRAQAGCAMSHLQNRGGALPVGYLARRLDGAREPLSRRRLAPTVDSRRIHPGPHADSPGSRRTHGSACRRAPGPPGKQAPLAARLETGTVLRHLRDPSPPCAQPPKRGQFRCQVTRVPVRLSAYPGFPIGVSFSTPAGYFTHLHRTEHDPTRVAPCCNPAWERTPGLSPLVSACLCVARFGTPGAESGSEVIKHVRRKRDGERENRPGAFRPEAWR